MSDTEKEEWWGAPFLDFDYWFMPTDKRPPPDFGDAIRWWAALPIQLTMLAVVEGFLHCFPSFRPKTGTDPANPSPAASAPAAPSPYAQPAPAPSLLQRGDYVDPGVLRAEAAMDAARGEGLLGLLRVKRAAHQERHLTEATVRVLRDRQAILEEQRRTVEASSRLLQAIRAHDDPPRPDPPKPRIASAQAALPAPALAPPLQPHITDEDIERLALRLMLEGVDTEDEWEAYRDPLSQHLPPLAVEEVGNRLRELWRMYGGT